MSNIKIKGTVNIIAENFSDDTEFPFEADTIDGAIAELGRIERSINNEIKEAENIIKDEN